MSIFRVEGFEISLERREVADAAGALVSLRPKTFDLLAYLLKNRDRVVAKDELLRELWPDAAVSENSVAQCIIELRKAMGDRARNARFIRTVDKSGYRFVGSVEAGEHDQVRPAAAALHKAGADSARLGKGEHDQVLPAAAAPRSRRWALLLATPAAAVILAWAGLRGRETGNAEARTMLMTSNLPAAHAYLRGVEAARQLHVAAALRDFQEAARLDPGFVMAEARIGFVYAVAWSRLEDGKPHLEKAFRQINRMNDLNRLYILAWHALANRDYDGAIRAYRELAGRFPNEGEARQQLGHVLSGEGRYEEARTVLEQALAVEPDAPQVHNTLSGVYLATRQFDRAVGEAGRFVQLLPREANAHDSLGAVHDARNEFDRAEADFRQALSLQPDFEIAQIHLANTLYRQGRFAEARQLLERYIARAPSAWERVRGADQLAAIALRMDDVPSARRHAEGHAVGSHHHEILLALRRGDLATADRLLAAQPEQADRGKRGNRRVRLYLLGERALAGGDAASAIRYFQQALAERTPLYLIDWYEDCLADAYRRTGRTGEAIEEYRRVLAIYPRLALTWFGLAKAFEAKGDREQAKLAYAKVAEIWKHGDAGIPALIHARRQAGVTDRSGSPATRREYLRRAAFRQTK